MTSSTGFGDFKLPSWPSYPAKTKPSLQLRNIRYADERSIDSYLEQLGGIPPERKQKRKVGINGLKPSAEIEIEQVQSERSVEFKINLLTKRLQEAGKLSLKRPEVASKIPNDEPPIILEKFSAKAYIFPLLSLEKQMIRHFKVWVGVPDARDFSDEAFVWSGSYLFLTEVHFDQRAHATTISGCSALRFLFNAIIDQPLYERQNIEGQEILGRWDGRSMSEKLQSMGGIALDAREIEVMYRIRYMTDEQHHVDADECRRVHDIIGYPFFIAD